jgi:predicted dehydrogenase
MEKIGCALVGTGNIARVHAQVLQSIAETRLVGVYDSVKINAERFADKFAVIAFQSYADLLADQQVGLIVLCTPSGMRTEYAVLGARAGKHIVCEKPIEVTLERIDRMIKVCEENRVTLTGIFNNRYNKVYRRVKEAVDSGSLGRLLMGDVFVKWYRNEHYYRSSDWRGTWKYDGGGALMNQSIHFIDLLQWIMGPIEEIKAFTATGLHPIEVEDTAIAVVRYESGALGVIEGTTAANPGLYDRLEIHGVNGSILIENGQIARWHVSGANLPEEELRELNRIDLHNHHSPDLIDISLHQAQMHETIQNIQNGIEPEINGHEARKAVEIILRIYQDAALA